MSTLYIIYKMIDGEFMNVFNYGQDISSGKCFHRVNIVEIQTFPSPRQIYLFTYSYPGEEIDSFRSLGN